MKPIKIWKVEYVDYFDVAMEAELALHEDAIQYCTAPEEYDSVRIEYYDDAKNRMKQTVYVEGKTRQGMIGNLKNLLYNCHLEILTAVPVM